MIWSAWPARGWWPCRRWPAWTGARPLQKILSDVQTWSRSSSDRNKLVKNLTFTEFFWTKKSHYGAKKLFLFHFLSKKIVWKTLNVRMEKKNWWFWRKMRFLIGFRFRILFGPLDSWMRQAHTGFLQQRKRSMKWKKARNILSATGF